MISFHSELCYSNGNDYGKVSVIINSYNKMDIKQLFDKANDFMDNNMNDSAYLLYSIIYNSKRKNTDTVSQRLICESLNKASTICFYNGNYKLVLELLLEALEICENINYDVYIGRIYNNIGNVHSQFNNFALAKRYYNLAYKSSRDNYVSGAALSNLGLMVFNEDKFDSALLLYKKAYNLQSNVKNHINNATINNIALIHQTMGRYDSAFFYYRNALSLAREIKNEEQIAKTLSNIGQLHLETNNFDSTVYYLEQSNILIDKSNYLSILEANYSYLSKMEEMKGNDKRSLYYYKKHSKLKDSLFNSYAYGTVNELLFTYNMAKVDKHIDQLNMEQEIKERTILMQRILQIIMGLILLTVIGFLVLLYFKNRSLNQAYNSLVKKNNEVIKSEEFNYRLVLEYEERLKEKNILLEKKNEETEHDNAVEENDKSNNNSISTEHKRKLELAILEIMNSKEVFCDPDFSITKLSEMVGSGTTYVSWVINNSFNKNFNTFINEYRIKESCRMLSDKEYEKYSIETIATMVGFRSKGSFNPIFKEITGVTPSIYARSLKSK